MSSKKKTKSGYFSPKRLYFPDDDAVHPWLSMLLDAYYLVDKGIAEAVGTELKKNRKLACSKGCSNCCRIHRTIPVYPLELVGISWYVTEKISGPMRGIINNQLKNYNENSPCPFLVEGSCSVHPVRPISCRQFIVFGMPCDEGEDPYYTRREDVLSPIKKYVDKAFFIMLPFYGVEKEFERLKIIDSGAIHNMVKLIKDCNWKSLADRMDEFDAKKLNQKNAKQ